jgi:hypothetical protein
MNNNKMSLNNPIMKSFSKQLSSAGQILTLIFMRHSAYYDFGATPYRDFESLGLTIKALQIKPFGPYIV